jgi:signal transduction histidine kinase
VKSGYVSHAKYKEMWNELTNGRVWISEIKNKAKDKTEFWEESTVMPSFDKDGFVDGYIAFKVEISEKMRLKEELQKQEEMMLVQSRHAAMGEMISMIAHQWRQPISVIAMDAANILVDVELEILDFEGLKEVSQNIINQTQELSKTIDDFRDFFKPNKVAEEITFEQIMHDTNAVLGKSLLNHSINFTQEIPNGIVLKTYDRELMQVLLNILKNAKEAFDDEKHYEKKIHLKVIPLGEKIQINISDNAGGIDEAILEKIFEPYFSTKELKNGTGLGLYICKTIIEKHLKGSIEVKNLQDGALFIIQIPCRIEND